MLRGLRLFWHAALVPVLVGASIPECGAAQSYRFYVASESEDEVTLLRFAPGEGLEREKVIRVGWLPAEIEAPHGLFVDPSGEHWYLTLGHGFPNGRLLKYETGTDTLVGSVELGLFPATIAVAPSGTVALAVNSNFHGDHMPSTVSIVDLTTMFEIDRVQTCTMPHGSRFSHDGRAHYSACMMDDQLVEIDGASLTVSRRLDLATGTALDERADHEMREGTAPVCSPTWATPSLDGQFVYVPCNRGHEILEIDVVGWGISRRFPAEGAPYNLALTPDGRRLLSTLKGSAHLAVWDLETGEQVARVRTTLDIAHGVVVTPDGRYTFVSVEGVAGEPGMVEVIDLATYERVATMEVGKQAGGIAFWRMEH